MSLVHILSHMQPTASAYEYIGQLRLILENKAMKKFQMIVEETLQYTDLRTRSAR